MGIIPDAPHHLQSNPQIDPSPPLASTSVVIAGQARPMEISSEWSSLKMDMVMGLVIAGQERSMEMLSLKNLELVAGPGLLPDIVLVAHQAGGSEPVGNVPVAPQPVGNVPVAPQPVGNVPVAPQPVNNVPVAPQHMGNVPVAPQLGTEEMNSLERRRLQKFRGP
eukprot:gene10516-7484_t